MSTKKINTSNFIIGSLLTAAFAPALASAAPPNISSTSGDVSQGAVISVSGTNFGTVRTADYWDTFDDYSNDWTKNEGGTAGLSATGSKWAGDGGWDTWLFSGELSVSAKYDTKPLLRVDSTNSNYSTGKAYTRTVEYYNVGSGHPNSGLALSTKTSNEVYLVWYFKMDAKWQYPYTSLNTEKHVEFFLSDGNKMNLQLDTQEHQVGSSFTNPTGARFFPIMGETGGDTNSCDPPTGDGAFPEVGKWHELKLHIKLNTPGSINGVYEAWLDGKKFLDDPTVNFIGSGSKTFGGSSGRIHFFGNIQSGVGAFTVPGAGNEWEQSLDDIWLWMSDQSALDSQFPLVPVVYLSNQSTWGNGPADKLNGDGNFVRQVVGGNTNADLGFKSWTDNQFKFKANLSGINTSVPLYLYVINWNGEVNTSGIPVQPGETGGLALPVPTSGISK